jgi:HK97 gp10 family phage protein
VADNIQFSILGLDEVLGRMEGLPKAWRKKGARFAMRKAANLVAAAAKQNAERLDDPATASVISQNIAVRFSSRRMKTTGDVMFRVGVRGGARLTDQQKSAGLPGGGTQHWRLLEFGTENARAQPFMRPSLSNNINQATDEFVKKLDGWTGRNLKKIKKQGL